MQYFILFLEGVITFVSPCLLPMLPLYVSYFAGGAERGGRRVALNALGFILGFTAVFVALGALAGTVGRLLQQYRLAVNIVAGLIVILFGLHFLGLFRLSFFRGIRFRTGERGGFFSSVLFGVIFSVGWTPCVGAFLGSALMMAAGQGSVMTGILMLLVYSLGLGIPFFISAILIEKLKGAFSFIKRHYRVINAVSGGLLVAIGILMATGLYDKLLGILA
ncbi:MAG: sulfite exporter TauE/SafE family protein [Clostridia bacterium]|nr:sulfite exporter TauE/SafE family protein [Clostridia bacterium]